MEEKHSPGSNPGSAGRGRNKTAVPAIAKSARPQRVVKKENVPHHVAELLDRVNDLEDSWETDSLYEDAIEGLTADTQQFSDDDGKFLWWLCSYRHVFFIPWPAPWLSFHYLASPILSLCPLSSTRTSQFQGERWGGKYTSNRGRTRRQCGNSVRHELE